MVFPARAGMSPDEPPLVVIKTSVPRASGDEPHSCNTVCYEPWCSPRERG